MTQIPYIDEHWGVVTGCSGQGCKCRDNCWARDMVRRFPAIHAGSNLLFDPHNPNRPVNFDVVQFHPDRLNKPLYWRKPRRIGVCFTGDWMDDQVKCEWIDDIMAIMFQADWHTYFTLTKQVKNLRERLTEYYPHPHIYHGVSICDQEDADTKIPDLLRIPGKHWISIEPMLSPVNLRDYLPIETIGGVEMESWPSWIVIGAESGPKRRPCPHEWMIAPVEQCQAAQVPVWVKAVSIDGKVVHDINLFPEALKVRQMPCAT